MATPEAPAQERATLAEDVDVTARPAMAVHAAPDGAGLPVSRVVPPPSPCAPPGFASPWAACMLESPTSVVEPPFGLEPAATAPKCRPARVQRTEGWEGGMAP